MDPLTHTLSGIALANLLSPEEHRIVYSGVLVVAANLPDVDFITRPLKTLGSPKYYHNLTHSIPGLLALSLAGTVAAKFLFPSLNGGLLFGLFLLGCCLHVLLDAVITSGYVRPFWPFSNRQVSLALLAGLNFRTSSKGCGRPQYVRCTLCQLRWGVWNPILILLLIGTILSFIWPDQRWMMSISSLSLCAAYLVFLAVFKAELKRRLLKRFPELKTDSLYLYPSDVVPARWIAVAENDHQYRMFGMRGIPPTIEETGRFPKADTLSHPVVERSKTHPLYGVYLPRMAHPYAEVDVQDGITQVTWKDLRYYQDPSIDLYALRLLYDSDLRVLREEFRERWNAGSSLFENIRISSGVS